MLYKRIISLTGFQESAIIPYNSTAAFQESLWYLFPDLDYPAGLALTGMSKGENGKKGNCFPNGIS